MPAAFEDAARGLVEVGRRFDARGWVFGTSGNFSAVVDRHPLRLAITSSGTSKGELDANQILEMDEDCRVTGDGTRAAVGGSAAPRRNRSRPRSRRGAAHALDVEHAPVGASRRRTGSHDRAVSRC